jgi:hypothetical protein
MRFRILLCLLCLTALSGCGFSGLDFHVDNRLKIVQPRLGESEGLPLRVKWTIKDFVVTGPDGSRSSDRGFFAVFVDRTPMAPGADIRSLAKHDPTCRNTPGCPNTEWLTEHSVFLTNATSLEISALPYLGNRHTPDRHEITIVLLNGVQQRIGESAFWTQFTIKRHGPE